MGDVEGGKKRGRGRPAKAEGAAAPKKETVKRSGSDEGGDGGDTKRGRGRVASPAKAPAATTGGGAKAGRGRPKKGGAAKKASPKKVPGRGRGRPKAGGAPPADAPSSGGDEQSGGDD